MDTGPNQPIIRPAPFDAPAPTAGGFSDQASGEVRQALEQEGRVMIAAIKLPDSGEIAKELKIAVRERAEGLRSRLRLSLRGLAKQLGSGCHEAILSRVLKGDYDHPDESHLRRLNAWCEATERRLASLRQEGICDLAVLRTVRTAVDFARAHSCGVVLFGPSGIGKTVSLTTYAGQDLEAVYVRLDDAHKSRRDFARLLADALHIDRDGSLAKVFERVVDKLKGSHRPLLCDEWHRAEPDLYELIRDLADLCEIPFVVCGTDRIQQLITNARVRKGSVWSDQFCSRVGWLVDLSRLKDQGGEPRPLYTLREVAEVFKSDRVRLSREALSFLQGIACSIGLGCLRMARRVFEMAAKLAMRGDGTISDAMLRKSFCQLAVPPGMDKAVLLRQVEEAVEANAAMAG